MAAAVAVAAAATAQRPSHAPERLPDGVRIRVDGRIDEAFWHAAVPITDLTQVVPLEGSAPTVETAVRVAYDADFLYVALECFDDPALVRARLMARDARLDPDDRVELWFDTFDDQRSGYWFQIGAAGSKGDALVFDGGQGFNKSWDGIWLGAARVGERGWSAELALPFKTLAFRQGEGSWGFNVRRFRKANDEEMRWASPRVAYRFFDLTVGGELVGMSGMDQGVGLDIVPYAKLSATDERDASPSTSGDFGGDLRYRITPALGFQLTYNTDFAETEVDSRQVNLTRFPLFFPEKRDFFLEDAGLFEFGAPSRRRDTVPYFSRRIGRSNEGDPVPILVGARLAGRAGDWNLGLLEVVLDIYTGGRPNERGYAQTFGADFVLTDSHAFGEGRSGSLWGYAMASEADGPGGEGLSYGVQGDYRATHWQHSATAHHVDEEFRPELGFVSRQGIRRYRWNSQYTWRSEDGGLLRRANWRLSPTLTTTDTDELDSWAVPWRWFEVVLQSEDSVQFETHRIFERLDESFELRGVEVLPGDYYQTRHFVDLEFSERRPVFGELRAEVGDFYDGDLVRLGGTASVLPSPYVQLSGSYDEYHVELSTGSFVTRVTEGRVDLTPSPLVALRNLVQYDNDSEELTFQSRLRWIFEPGRELFVVGLFGWERPPDQEGGLAPTGSEVAVKLVYTLRF